MQLNLMLFSAIRAAVREDIAIRSIVPEVTKTVEVGYESIDTPAIEARLIKIPVRSRYNPDLKLHILTLQ